MGDNGQLQPWSPLHIYGKGGLAVAVERDVKLRNMNFAKVERMGRR